MLTLCQKKVDLTLLPHFAVLYWITYDSTGLQGIVSIILYN